MIRICKICKKEFEPPIAEVNRGNGYYCSRKCGLEVGKRIFQQKAAALKLLRPKVKCAFCGLEYSLKPSQLKNSKSGLYFCCREHKDMAQRIGGIKEIMPPHYGMGNGCNDYRERALAHYGSSCQNPDCVLRQNNTDVPVIMLDVHHKDRDRTNSHIDNLEVLCVWCHARKTRKLDPY